MKIKVQIIGHSSTNSLINNAQTELIAHIEQRGPCEVKYISIIHGSEYSENRVTIEGTLFEVLPQLNFEYDSGFGGQNLYGTVWYEDGTWSSRGEYEGSEWWQYNVCPPLPKSYNPN
jgi:hypothetical protein